MTSYPRRIVKTLIISSLTLPVLFLVASSVVWRDALSQPAAFMTVHADDDEDKEEDDEDNKDEGQKESEEEKSKPRTKTVRVVKEVVEYRPVAKTVIVTEEGYTIDTDGDLLVDAIDPDPKVPQSEYFTDIDDDGVPNAIDRHHDEDDFSYYEFETDDDNNGILDSYEEE